mmetsp:Transcript_18699/g.42700  ORF Transcript_18699/g.42700 Transcript_18699/m.42700 type:complete len:144 (-) Transcript_18699:127-558(-)
MMSMITSLSPEYNTPHKSNSPPYANTTQPTNMDLMSNLPQQEKKIRSRKGEKKNSSRHLYVDHKNYEAYMICKKFSESRMEKERKVKQKRLEESFKAGSFASLSSNPSDVTETTSNTFHSRIKQNPLSCSSYCGGFDCINFTC